MFTYLETMLLGLAQSMPLPLFAGIASFVEEVIAPIPSGAVLLLIGSLAGIQEYPIYMLMVLAGIAMFGKLLGALLIYVVADKAEDLATARFPRFLGVTHEDLEKFGSRLGKGWKDYAILTLLRALPVVPSAVVSFGAGVLRIPLRVFIFATVVGSLIRDITFISIGYYGFEAGRAVLDRLSEFESTLQIGVALGLLIAIGAYLYLRKRAQNRKA